MDRWWPDWAVLACEVAVKKLGHWLELLKLSEDLTQSTIPASGSS